MTRADPGGATRSAGSSAAAGAGGGAVVGEDSLELLQRGVRPDPRGVKVGPAHPEPGLGQVLQEPVEPGERGQGSAGSLRSGVAQGGGAGTDLGMFLPRRLCRWML